MIGLRSVYPTRDVMTLSGEPKNAEFPMLVTLLGIMILPRLEQSERAFSQMEATLLPIAALVSLLHSRRRCFRC